MDARGGIEVLAAIGGREPRSFLSDEKPCALARAFDIENHHIGEFVGTPIMPEIGDRWQAVRLAQRAEPGVEQHALLDGPHHRGVGAGEFHV
ncbi:hypothetical protein [Bradyrhizobium sp. STM 3562]|uniref:hypothetical protein n=1 Tax=Bradyrhizobium sp. STM 3562 TaxID=578924 RepID=UPI00388EBC62